MKKFLLGLGIVVVLLVIIAFFLPKEVEVSRSLTMNASQQAAYEQVADFKNWQNWMPWTRKDSTMVLTFNESTNKVGDSYSWVGKDGTGKLTFAQLNEFSEIGTSLVFDEMDPSQGTWTFVPEGDKVAVTWTMKSNMGNNPMTRWFGLFFDGMIGPDFEAGLANIDSILQIAPPAPTYSVDIIQETVTGIPYLAIHDSASTDPDSIGARIGRNFGTIMGYMGQNNITMGGAPMTITYEWEPAEGYTIFRHAIPTAEVVVLPEGSNMISDMSHTGNAVKAIHIGPFTGLETTYEELMRYIEDNGMTIVGAPWEVYVDDPSTVDESEMRTFVYFPVN